MPIWTRKSLLNFGSRPDLESRYGLWIILGGGPSARVVVVVIVVVVA